MAITLENNHVKVPDSFFTVAKNFKPKFPSRRTDWPARDPRFLRNLSRKSGRDGGYTGGGSPSCAPAPTRQNSGHSASFPPTPCISATGPHPAASLQI
jgi:hypothetical protein